MNTPDYYQHKVTHSLVYNYKWKSFNIDLIKITKVFKPNVRENCF